MSQKNNKIIIYNTNIFSNSIRNNPVNEWDEKMNSILQQVPTKANLLKPIILFLATTVSPAKIYMLANVDMPKQFDYIDLLITISNKSEVPFKELEPILDIAYLKNQRIACSLHKEGNVIEGLKNGHIFYSLNCIPENLVFDDKVLIYPVTSPDALKQMKQTAFEKFTGYYNKARDFYESATLLNQNRSGSIVLFMLHQAAELIYRGLLLSLNQYDKRTHEIRSLKKYARRCAWPLNEYLPDFTENDKRLLHILDNGYLRSRYEDNYPIDDTDLVELFERVKILLISSKEYVEMKTIKV